MKKSFILFFIVCYSLFVNSLAQTVPDYNGRNKFFGFDSSRQFLSANIYSSASDGIINADDYYVGPGDKLLVNIQGITPLSFSAIINYEGYVFIEQSGLINVNNMSLNEAKITIIKKLKEFFRNVKIDVVLAEYKKIRVSLVGNVFKSFTYTVNGNTRLLDLIMNSSGLYSNSNLRQIQVIDNYDSIKYYDLLRFMRLGDKSVNPILREGSRVVIEKVDQTVTVYGNVAYPGTYEFIEGDNLERIITLAGGIDSKARLDSVELISFTSDNINTKISYYNISEISNSNIKLKSGDKVIVRSKSEFMIDRFVQVIGSVKYPGVYRIQKDKTYLKNLLINEVGGFVENASLKDSYIIRNIGSKEIDYEYERLKSIPRTDMTDDEYDYFKARSRELKGKMVIDFEKLFLNNDDSEDIVLKEEDMIYVPESKNYITLVGQIVNPGNIIFNSSFSVDDYIKLAGGFAWRAVEGDVRVIKANTREWLDADDVSVLEPGDVIWIPEETPPPKFWDVFKDSMLIVGQAAALITAIVAIIISSRN
ncbi:MAG: SLBB domain-containing protein [bacterium]